MVMADYSEFNNNNYLPGVYGDMETAAFNYQSAMANIRGSGITQNGFTFTSPTQCSTLATHRPSIQTTSSMSCLSAPGVGASWQHSIPVTMPWVAPGSHPGLGTTTVFTGTPAQPYLEGQQSCSPPFRRPKRKALDLPDEAPTSKIYLCADQFANLKISPAGKQNHSLPTDDAGHACVQFYAGAGNAKSKVDIEGWQRFRDVENRLDVELDEDIGLSVSGPESCQEGPCLKVAEGVLDSVLANSPVLPRRVVDDLTKPCMQIVLWKSPGEIIREVAKEKIKTSSSGDTSPTTTSNITTNSKMNVPDRFPLTSRDNIMDTNLDTSMVDPVSHSIFHQAPPVNSLPLGSFLPPLSNMVPQTPTGLAGFGVADGSGVVIEDLDMCDAADDDMQL